MRTSERRLSLGCTILSLLAVSSLLVFCGDASGQTLFEVTFVNQTQGEVRLFWLNTQTQQETRYAVISPGDSFNQPSYQGLIWVARNAAGEQLARIQASQSARTVVINPAESVPSADGAGRRSQAGGAQATLKVTNNTQGNINLIWATYEGQQQSYGALAAGRSRDLLTGIGHIWIIRDPATNRELQSVTVTMANQSVTIGDGQPQPGGQMVAVPRVVGMNKAAAEQVLQAAGFAVQSVATEGTTTTPQDFVFSQNPAAGAQAQRGAQVVIHYLARPNAPQPGPQATVPSVVGQQQAQAEAQLRAAGLTPQTTAGNAAPQPNLAGVVYQQSVAAGAQVANGATIIITVYGQQAAPMQVSVPSVVGMSSQAAQSTLQSAGLQAEFAQGDETPDAAKVGTIQAQNPAAGALAPRGGTVSIRFYRQAQRFSGPTPQDADSSIPLPSMVVQATAGGLDIVWKRSDGAIMYSTYSGPDFQGATHTQLNGLLPLLGGFAKDDQGNGYVLTAKQEQEPAVAGDDTRPNIRRPGVLQIHKIAQGQRSASLLADLNAPFDASQPTKGRYYTKWGVYNPILHSNDVRTSARLKHGNGVLAATFIHNIPGKDGLLHNTGCLLAIDTNGAPVYTDGGENHGMDVQLGFDGSSFVRAQEGDQGILVSQLSRDNNGKWTWTNDKMGVAAAQAGLKHFFRLGGFFSTQDKHVLIYSYVENGWGFHPNEREWWFGTNGASLYMTTLPKNLAPLPAFNWQTRAIGPGVSQKLLAQPPAGSNIVRPQVVDMKNGRYVVVWEQWTEQNQQPTHQKTLAMLIDANGAKLAGPKELSGARIQRSTDAFFLPSSQQAGFIAGNAQTGRIMLHTLDNQLNLQTHALPIQ